MKKPDHSFIPDESTDPETTKVYIEPQFESFNNLDDLIHSEPSSFPIDKFFDESAETFSFEGFFATATRAFIIADPGYGKSELLQQIVKQANQENERAEFIELRKLDAPSDIEALDTEKYSTFCFDALDEVRQDRYNGMVSQLRAFCRNNLDKSIFISCRKHDAANHHIAFTGFTKMKYIQIAPFSVANIKTYVQQAGIKDDELIHAVIDKASPRRGNASILAVPRYLKTLTDLVKQGDVATDEIKQWKRKDFFDRFIYTRLDEAMNIKENLKSNEKEITRRVLEKMALIMEIYQVNTITKDEFISFLDGIESNINLVFFNVCDIDTFLDRVLQPRKEKEVEWLEFHNTEFQEFLAAKELDRLASSGQVVYDFAVQPEFKKIYPNWYDVLRYLVEINPRHIFPLLEFLKQQKEGWVENAFWGLLAGIDPDEMSKQERARIFDRVFTYVQETPGVWVVHNLVNLGAFFEKENYHLVKEPPVKLDTKDGQRRFYNQVDILDDVLLKLGDAEKENWRALFKGLVANHTPSKVKEIALIGLAHAGSIQDLEELYDVFEEMDEVVKDSFAYSCHYLNPNEPFALKVFLEGIKNTQNRSAIDGINKIEDKKQLKHVLESFLKDSTLLIKYFESTDRHISVNQFGIIGNLEKSWDSNIEELLFKLFKMISQNEFEPDYKKAEFEKKLLLLLAEKNPAILTDMIKVVPSLWMFLCNHGESIAKVLKPDFTGEFIEKCRLLNENVDGDLVHNVFWRLYNKESKEQKAEYKVAKVYFSGMLERYENPPDWSELQAEEESKIKEKRYAHFQYLLEPEPGMMNFNVFKYALDNIDVVLGLATEYELARLKDFVKRILPEIDSSKANIKVTGEGGTQFSIPTHIVNFCIYIELAKALKIVDGIEIPREHLIGFLPLMQDDSNNFFKEEVVLEQLGDITDEDIRYLKELIESKKGSDFIRFSPVGIAKVINQYKIEPLIPVLEDLVKGEDVPYYNRMKILALIVDTQPKKSFLKETFELYKGEDDPDLLQIGISANEKLIEIFNDADAIAWRFTFIKEKLAEKYEEEDHHEHLGHWIPPWEEEMYSQRMIKVLINLRSEQLIPDILDILSHAFTLIKKDSAYEKYVDYLFKLVHQYYVGIKDKVSYGVLKELFSFIDTHFPKEKSLFSPYRTQLEIEYIQIHDKPVSIQPCINKYNEIKKRAYLPIYDVQDLSFLLRQIIDEDIRRFVHHQGFYKVVDKHFVAGRGNIQEDYIQKTLAIQMENALLKRGFREVDIIREPQLMDDKRIDLLVKYGFIQPIVIELKLLHNSEIVNAPKRSQYKSKLVQYMRSQGADHCIYLIFKVQPKHHETYFNALREEYKDMEGIFIPDFIDCTIN